MSLKEFDEPILNIDLLMSNVQIAEINTFRVTPSTVECPICLGTKYKWRCEFNHAADYYKMKCPLGHYLTIRITGLNCSKCKGAGMVFRG